MGLLDKNKNAVGDSKNFKYLDDLIHSGAKEIVLDSDIVLGDDEESQYSQGIKLDADDLIVDGNGHTIDARRKTRIFYCTGKRITLKNMTLTRGSFDGYGGAIYIYKGDLTVMESIFQNNFVSIDGAAIYNDGGNLSVFESKFVDNISGSCDGTIFNDEGNLIVRESIFDHNACLCDCIVIYNEFNSSAIIEKSRFINNGSEDWAIYNSGHLTIKKSQFKDDRLKEKAIRAIYNEGVMTIQDTCFDVKTGDSSKDVYNDMHLIINGGLSLSQAESIDNDGVIILSKDFTDEINIPGKMIKLEALGKNHRDFTYLNELINGESNKIKLENDILLNIENHEDEKFKNGIKIDKDHFEIDGNGHTIDAQGLTRIFECTGKNIFIKNITLKNGFSEEKGGAIYNDGMLTIMESTLKGNLASYGGAIYNHERELNITDSLFVANMSKWDGGAIKNGGELSITDSTLLKNASSRAGAIYNLGRLRISASKFAGNTAKFEGAISNEAGECIVFGSTFVGNETSYDCGAIYSWKGELKIWGSTLKENTADRYGGAIYLWNCDSLTIIESTLTGNTAKRKGGALYLKKSKYKSENCTFMDNEPDDVYEEKD